MSNCVIMDDGIRLEAVLELPGTEVAKCPLVILIHGFTGYKEEPHILAAAEAVRAAGMAVLRVDMYGHGSSGGSFRRHNLYKWLNNMLAIIDYARGLDFVTDLYLCGHSQGGLTVMLAGAMCRDRIAGIMPLSPATMIPEMARRGDMLGTAFDPQRIPEVLDSWDGGPLDGNYLRVAQTIHVEEAIDRYDGPVLIVHGTADETVPYSYAEEAAARYRNARLVPVPGDTHCFDYHMEQMAAAITEWLKERQM